MHRNCIEFNMFVIERKMLMYIVNLTSHSISIIRDDNKSPLVIAPHGIVCRVKEETKTVSSINGIPVRVSHPTDVEGLPPQQEGVIYIVF